MKKQYKLSIVIPFFNEEEVIDVCLETIINILTSTVPVYEVICIDDGSTDETFNKLKTWHKKDSNVKILKLSRNFGKEAALAAGFQHVSGDCAITLDADLQDPPQEIPRMIEQWQKGYDVVLMKRCSRNDTFLKKMLAGFFYNEVAKLCHIPIESNVGDFRLLDKKAIIAFNQLTERNRFSKGLLSWAGFKTITLLFDRPSRIAGSAKMNLGRCIKLAFDAIFSFSIVPIRLFTLFGLFLALCSFIWGGWIIYQKICLSIDVPGYASIITAIVFLNGTIMIGIGLLGEYISRIYTEVKNRPIYVIDEKIE